MTRRRAPPGGHTIGGGADRKARAYAHHIAGRSRRAGLGGRRRWPSSCASRDSSFVRKVDGDTVLERARKIARARLWRVVFYNDDYTTKWFVVEVLQQFFRMSETSA